MKGYYSFALLIFLQGCTWVTWSKPELESRIVDAEFLQEKYKFVVSVFKHDKRLPTNPIHAFYTFGRANYENKMSTIFICDLLTRKVINLLSVNETFGYGYNILGWKDDGSFYVGFSLYRDKDSINSTQNNRKLFRIDPDGSSMEVPELPQNIHKFPKIGTHKRFRLDPSGNPKKKIKWAFGKIYSFDEKIFEINKEGNLVPVW